MSCLRVRSSAPLASGGITGPPSSRTSSKCIPSLDCSYCALHRQFDFLECFFLRIARLGRRWIVRPVSRHKAAPLLLQLLFFFLGPLIPRRFRRLKALL